MTGFLFFLDVLLNRFRMDAARYMVRHDDGFCERRKQANRESVL